MLALQYLIGIVWALCLVSGASAATIRMDFDIYDSNGPAREIKGTLVYQADSPTARIQSLTSLDLTIDGHKYSVDDIGFISDWFEIYVLIGKMSPEDSINEVFSGTDDFFLIWDRTSHVPREFVYSSSRRAGAWLTPIITLSFSVVPEPLPPAPVPVSPVALLLVACAIGLVGYRKLDAVRLASKSRLAGHATPGMQKSTLPPA